MDMKFAVYFNSIVVYSKFSFQELLNVEQLGRPRPFPFLRDFRLQRGSLYLWPRVPFVTLFPRSLADVIRPCLTCLVRVAVREMYPGMADVRGAPVFSGSHRLRIS